MGFREQKKGWCEISASFRRVFGDIFEVFRGEFFVTRKRGAEKPLKPLRSKGFSYLDTYRNNVIFFIFEV